VNQQERRRHVRIRPLADYLLRATLEDPSGPARPLEVIDVSISGLAVSPVVEGAPSGALTKGSELALRLVFPQRQEHAVRAVVRWTGEGVVGLELLEPSEPLRRALGRYIGELLERGALS
jgi:hypothetical protein